MKSFLDVAPAAGAAFFSIPQDGPVIMLNLLRYRSIADYSQFPELAPPAPISGEAAYALYMEHTIPFLQKAGSELLYQGAAGKYLIGPEDGHWDLVLLVKHASAARFLEFARDEEYLKIAGHRTAALLDSRLLPMWP